MVKQVKCPNCKSKNNLTANTIIEKAIDGVFVTYTVCPVCGFKTVRQLDNEETREICKRLIKFVKTEKIGNIKGRKLDPKHKESMKILEKRLIIKRKKLDDMWDKFQDIINKEADQEA